MQTATFDHALLDYALLATISDQRDYGYSLISRLATTLEPFAIEAPPRRATLYHSLTRLETARWIERVDPPDPASLKKRSRVQTRRRRERYQLASDGERALADFVASPMPVEPTRLHFIVRLLCASQTDVERFQEFLEGWRSTCLLRLEEMGRARISESRSPYIAYVGKLIDQGIHGGIQAQLDWIEYALAGLVSFVEPR